MERKEWRQRLLDSEIPETVVDELMTSMKDEDFARMKDMSKEQILETLREGVVEGAEPIKKDDDSEPIKKDDDSDDPEADDDSLVETFKALGDYVAGIVKETLESHTMEVEIPALSDIQSDITVLKESMESFNEISKIMKDMLESDEQRLKGLVRDMSQASRIRLRRSLDDNQIVERLAKRLKEKEKVVQQVGFRSPPGDGFQPVVRDSQGNTYATLEDMAAGNPIES